MASTSSPCFAHRLAARPLTAPCVSYRVASVSSRPARGAPPSRLVTYSSVGQDAVGSWLDLAGFVAAASSAGARTPYDELADKIGRDCYIDVAGWHLFLKDVKIPAGGQVTLAQGLAQQLGAQVGGCALFSSNNNAHH